MTRMNEAPECLLFLLERTLCFFRSCIALTVGKKLLLSFKSSLVAFSEYYFYKVKRMTFDQVTTPECASGKR